MVKAKVTQRLAFCVWRFVRIECSPPCWRKSGKFIEMLNGMRRRNYATFKFSEWKSTTKSFILTLSSICVCGQMHTIHRSFIVLFRFFFRLSNIEMIYAGSVLGCRWWMGACTNANTFVSRSNSQCLTSHSNYTLASYIINKCTNKSSGRNMKRSVAMAPDKKCLHFSDRIIEFKWNWTEKRKRTFFCSHIFNTRTFIALGRFLMRMVVRFQCEFMGIY